MTDVAISRPSVSTVKSDADEKKLAEMQTLMQQSMKEMEEYRKAQQEADAAVRKQFETEMHEKDGTISGLVQQVSDANLRIQELQMTMQAHKTQPVAQLARQSFEKDVFLNHTSQICTQSGMVVAGDKVEWQRSNSIDSGSNKFEYTAQKQHHSSQMVDDNQSAMKQLFTNNKNKTYATARIANQNSSHIDIALMKKLLIQNLRKDLRESSSRLTMSCEKKHTSQTRSGSQQSDLTRPSRRNKPLPAKNRLQIAWNGDFKSNSPDVKLPDTGNLQIRSRNNSQNRLTSVNAHRNVYLTAPAQSIPDSRTMDQQQQIMNISVP